MDKMNFSIFDGQAKVVPTFIEKENTGKPYLNYGIDNRFPNYLWELYLRSAILQSIINGTADYVGGDGINYSMDTTIQRLKEQANKDGETLDDIIKNYSDKNVLIVSHGGVCRVIETYFNDMTTESFSNWFMDNCGLIVYNTD